MSRLDLELFLAKGSWMPWLGAVFTVAAIVVHQSLTTRLEARLAQLELAAEAIRKAPPRSNGVRSPERPLIEVRHDAFQRLLGSKKELNAQVGKIFAEADRCSLVLAQAEYKLDFDKAGRFWTYQIDLPVRGPYPQLRKFVDETLRTLPNASLEQIDVKREAIGARSAEAKFRFVLYLKDTRS